MKKAIRYHFDDNSLVALEVIEKGDAIEIDGVATGYTALDSLPMGHKIAACDIKKGELISKYGHAIGIAKHDIKRGQHIHTHNVSDLISDWRKYHQIQYDPKALREISEDFIINNPPKLFGYKRKNGMVGFRNYVLVISTAVCANQPVEELGVKHRDIVTIPNPSGCVILPNEVQRLKDIILGLARNPNVGAVIFNGLGCESIEAEWFYDQVKDEKKAAFIRAQSLGSCDSAFVELEKVALEMKAELDRESRVEVSISDIRLGTKCGASDWTTAAVSNPAIGFASDLVVKNGGISLLGETVGWFGGEETLIRQSRTKNVADRIIELMGNIYDRALAVGRRIEEGNPAPGNIAGGITTLNEKALGNVKKGGTAPIEGVLNVGEYPKGKGLFVLDNPGLDPISLLGLTCSSANILLYSTGRGTPVGNPIAPAIKLTGSPDAVALFHAHMDVELPDVLTGEISLAQAGWRLFNEIIDVANGKQTIAEKGRHREFSFPLLMAPL